MLLSRGMLMGHSPNGKGEVVASSSFFAEEADKQVLEAMYHPLAEKCESSSTVHHSFNEFNTRNLSFCLSIVVREGKSR